MEHLSQKHHAEIHSHENHHLELPLSHTGCPLPSSEVKIKTAIKYVGMFSKGIKPVMSWSNTPDHKGVRALKSEA